MQQTLKLPVHVVFLQERPAVSPSREHEPNCLEAEGHLLEVDDQVVRSLFVSTSYGPVNLSGVNRLIWNGQLHHPRPNLVELHVGQLQKKKRLLRLQVYQNDTKLTFSQTVRVLFWVEPLKYLQVVEAILDVYRHGRV